MQLVVLLYCIKLGLLCPVDYLGLSDFCFYASTQCGRKRSGIVSVSVVRRNTLLTRYLEKYLTYFHQTYNNDSLRDTDECFIFGVKRFTLKVMMEQNVLEIELSGSFNTILLEGFWDCSQT